MTEQRIPKGYKLTEVGVIPEDWEVKALEEVALVIDPHPSHRAPSSTKNGIPFAGIGDLDKFGNLITDNCRIVSLQVLEEHKTRYKLKDGLIGLGRVASIGKVVKLSIGEDYIISPTLGVINGKLVDNFFLFYILDANVVKKQFLKIMSGSTRSSVGMIVLRKLNIPVPNIKEQTAIANALSDTDVLINQLKKLISKKQAIKTATMQQLLTGKTRLPEFAYRADGSLKGTKISELGVIPDDWDIKMIDDLFEVTAGGDLRKNDFANSADMKYVYPIYSNAVTNKGLYGYSSSFDYEAECITITARGSIGYSLHRKEKFCAIGRLLILVPKKILNNKFFSEYINEYVKFYNESTGVPQLTAPQTIKTNIVYPSFKEQTAIANNLSEMDQEITLLETRLAKSEQIKQGMMQQLLTGKIRLI